MEISTEKDDSSVTLILKGDLSIRWVSDLKKNLLDCFEMSDVCLLDLTEVTDIDLSVIQTLYSAYKTAEKLNRQFKLHGPCPDLFRQAVSDAGYAGFDWLCFQPSLDPSSDT